MLASRKSAVASVSVPSKIYRKPRRTTTPHHDARSTLCSNATIGMETRARKTKSARRDAHAADAGEAIPRLLNDIVVTHILKTEHFDDPADLARLPAVSRAMRDAVAGTGLRFEKLNEKRAVNLGCLSALQRLHRGGRLSHQHYLCEAGARSGQLDELKVLRANGCPWDRKTCWAAAWGGHLEVLQWARANGCPWDEQTCREAAKGGHLEVLQWARANGCPWNESTCRMAAYRGHLEVLHWARANGCPWNEQTCRMAAVNGHLEVLQWLRANGCPWNANTCAWAARNGHLELMNWARVNGCPG